jgi:hypothetical protein
VLVPGASAKCVALLLDFDLLSSNALVMNRFATPLYNLADLQIVMTRAPILNVHSVVAQFAASWISQLKIVDATSKPVQHT